MDSDAIKILIVLYGLGMFYHIFATNRPKDYYLCQSLEDGKYLNPLSKYELQNLYLKAPEGYLDSYHCEPQKMSYNDVQTFIKAHK